VSEQSRPRMAYAKFAPEVICSLYAIGRCLRDSGPDTRLLHKINCKCELEAPGEPNRLAATWFACRISPALRSGATEIPMSETELFFDAIRCGDIAAVSALLDNDPALLSAKNAQSQSPVLFSIYNRQNEIRDLFLSRGACLELHEAAAAGDLSRVKGLVAADSSLAKNFSPDGFPVVALAAVFGNFEVAKYLHAQGGDINAVATNGSGYTALTGAVTSGHTEIAKWLLENGAEPNYSYANGYTPFLAAAANGHLEILKALLGHGADLRAKTTDGKNALTFAIERKHAEVENFLRENGLS
jgi:uncharacterized protein